VLASRQKLRRRALVAAGLSSLLLLAACGGGSSKAKTSPSTDGGTGADVSTTTTSGGSGGNGDCFTTPGSQHAKVRFVNLFTNATYKAEDIQVLQGFSGADPCGKKLATVPYGTASDYVDVTAGDDSGNWNAGAYVGGATDQNHEIITQSETWKGGEQVTIVFMGAQSQAGNSPSAGADQTFFEKNDTGGSESFPSVAGKAVVGIGAAALQYVVKDGSWRAGIAGKAGCLKSADDTATSTTNIGGTSLVQYPVDAGTLQLSLYPSDPGTCAGKADMGPVSVDASAGGRTFVLAYGTTAQDLKLLVLPVAS
jgi:hypothetical protein